jgi:predicted phosphoribosyltransferase
MQFRDRREAGRLLAEELAFLKGREGLIVLAIPRGGVVVGYEVARALGAPLDVYVTRKIGAPGNPELAIGAVASDGTVVLDEEAIQRLGVSASYIEEERAYEQGEIERRLSRYRGERPALELGGRTVILTDDGIATGATTLAAIRALREAGLARLILAVPVAPQSTVERMREEVDQLICLHAPRLFWAVGQFYLAFDQTSDGEVVELLAQAAQ